MKQCRCTVANWAGTVNNEDAAREAGDGPGATQTAGFFLLSGVLSSVIAKLVRNALMVAVVPGMAFLYSRRAASETHQNLMGVVRFIPLFVVGFAVMAALRSTGDAALAGGVAAMGVWDSDEWRLLIDNIAQWASYLLAVAMAGVGSGTSIKTIRGLGLKSYAGSLPSMQHSERNVCDLELLATGGFSPLDRFMSREDHQQGAGEVRLAGGYLFPIPVSLPAGSGADIHLDKKIALRNSREERDVKGV